MYNTPDGIRVLSGPEKRLFTESLGMMVDLLSDGDLEFGVAVFDRLERNQKIAALHSVARALLTEDQPPPDFTASIEAAVASVYQHARDMLYQEIEEGTLRSDFKLPTWRELVLAAAREVDGIGALPEPQSTDNEEWEFLHCCLEDQVLWDSDWEAEKGLDLAPEASRCLKEQLGIPDDYYIAVPPDPSAEQAECLLEELRTLLRKAADALI